MNSTRTAREAAFAAVGPFLAEVAQRIRAAASNGQTTVDVDDLEPAIAAVFDAYQPGSATAGLRAVRAVLGRYTSHAVPALERGLLGDVSANVSVFQLDAALLAFDAALCDFDRQPELDKARARIDDLLAERDGKLAELEAAVDAADLDTVMALRPVVEVDLPGQLGDAKQHLLDLLAERAAAERALPAERAQAAVDAAGQASADVLTARAALAAAEQAEQVKHQARTLAVKAAATATTAHSTAIAARDSHGQRHAAEQRSRLRALAGLPPTSTSDTATLESDDDRPATRIVHPATSIHGGHLDNPPLSDEAKRRTVTSDDGTYRVDPITASGHYASIDMASVTGTVGGAVNDDEAAS